MKFPISAMAYFGLSISLGVLMGTSCLPMWRLIVIGLVAQTMALAFAMTVDRGPR